MKNFRIYLRLLIFLGIALLFITAFKSYIEYRSGRAAVLSLFETQAKTMIISVAKAGEKGLIAYQSLQEQTIQKLLTVGAALDFLDRKGNLSRESLAQIGGMNQLAAAILFDKSGKPTAAYPSNSAPGIDSSFVSTTLLPFLENNRDYFVIGFTSMSSAKPETFEILYRSQAGGAILVGIDSANLQRQRRAFGTGSIIEDISQGTGVEYAGILAGGNILVATRNFPIQEPDAWYGTELPRGDSIVCRITRITDSGGNIFEATGPFIVAGQNYGNIVLGLDTSVLGELSAKLKRDIFWQSILSLLITLAAVSGVVLWNNFRLVSRKYDQIKSDVQKLEADKAVKARLASMGELAGGVAHEIRNPLNAIRVIIQRLQREFSPETDRDEYLELTDIVKRETDRINETIEQFLKIARPPALQKSKDNLNNCINNALVLFNSRARQRNITVGKNLNKLPDISLDTRLCGSALLNILENALDAVGENGTISIKSYVKARKIYIEIGDSGPGISEDLKSRIFDLYYTTKETGTGLGLPSVLMTVKGHGGSVEVLDNPGGGTIFRLEFPIE